MGKKGRKSSSGSASRPARAAATTGSRMPIILYAIAAFLAVVGLADSTYLTASHLSGETVTCIGAANCSDVLGSSYAKIGSIPLAALGLFAYFVAFSAATLAAFGYPRARAVLMIAVTAMLSRPSGSRIPQESRIN